MNGTDLQKFLNDNINENKMNIIGKRNFNKTISNLKVNNKKIQEFLKIYEDQEVITNMKQQSEERDLKISKSKPNFLNYVKYQENYSNWVDKIKNNLLNKDRKINSNPLKYSNEFKSTIKGNFSITKILNHSRNFRKNSSNQLNKSLEKNDIDSSQSGRMQVQINKVDSKDEETIYDNRKSQTDIKNDTISNFWKSTHDNDSNHNLLRKIYDKKLILDLKLDKDAHLLHLERVNIKAEEKKANSIYIQQKIINTKKKILFIKGIVDYAFPKIMVTKIKSVKRIKISKTESNSANKYINTEVLSKNRSHIFSWRIDETNNTKTRNNSNSPNQNKFTKTISIFKTKKSAEKIKNSDNVKKIRFFTPLKIKSFSFILVTK